MYNRNRKATIATIPTSFFKEEVRDGFFVSPHIKQAWAEQLKVLSVIDDICKRNGILYFADWGTMLGAIRHGGYVPWDDDLDICMKREDYQRFREAAKTEFPDGFDIYDFRTKDNHWLFLANVVNKNRICFEEDHLAKFDNFPYIATVDIFLLDYLYRDSVKEKDRSDRIMRLLAISETIINDTALPEVKKDLLDEIYKRYHVKISPEQTSREIGIAIYDLIERIMIEVPEDEADEIGQIFPFILKGGSGLPKKCFAKSRDIPFEYITIPVPEAYHKIMSHKYGEYMHVVKGAGAHDYPYYEVQKDGLRKVAGGELPEFSVTKQLIESAEAKKKRYRAENASIKTDSACRQTVIFFTTSPEGWAAMEGLYKGHAEDEACDVFVVPLPLYRKDVYGRITGEPLYELEKYPDDLPGYLYEDIDTDSYYADIIYIQSAYDAESPVLTVPLQFYTDRLIEHCDRLILVPPAGQADFYEDSRCDIYNTARYLNTPGAVNSDIIYANTQQLRERYIEILTGITGDDTRNYWEKKTETKEILAVPACGEGGAKHRKGENMQPKTILYCIGINELFEYGDGKLQAAVRQRLDTFASNLPDNMRVKVYFFPSQDPIWNDTENRLVQDIKQLISEYGGDERFVEASDEDMDSLADECVAYYGAPSPLVYKFTSRSKPAMISSEDAVEWPEG